MILEIEDKSKLPISLEIIQKSFATVADEFHLTKENCPGHPTFMTLNKLQHSFESGKRMFLYCSGSKPVGFFSLKQFDSETWEMDHLAVLPKYRHRGIGRELLKFAEKTVKQQNGKTLKIGIIEKNEQLKQWYLQNGFVSTGTSHFEHLPVTVGFMMKDV